MERQGPLNDYERHNSRESNLSGPRRDMVISYFDSTKSFDQPKLELDSITKGEHGAMLMQMQTGVPKRGTVESEPHLSNFVSRIVDYFGMYKSVPETDPTKSLKYVEDFLRDILHDVEVRDARFKGRLKSCQLSTEGLRLNHPNEFVYVLELRGINSDDLDIVHVNATGNVSKLNEDLYGKSRFQLTFKNTVPYAWSPSPIQPTSNLTLRPLSILNDFVSILYQVMGDDQLYSVQGSHITFYASLSKDNAKGILTDHGSFKVKQHHNLGSFALKIHMFLAISVERMSSTVHWPLEGTGDTPLDKELKSQNVVINKCHLVADGEFWRVDFSRWMNHQIFQMTENIGRRNCWRALKNIREYFVLNDPLSDPLLDALHFKLAFLDENTKFKDDKDWRSPAMSYRLMNILREVEHGRIENRRSEITDTLFRKRHWASLEARRMREYVEGATKQHTKHGIFHLALISSVLICNFILFLFAVVHLVRSIKWNGMSCPTRLPQFAAYPFAHIVLCIVALVLSLIGTIWICAERFQSGPLHILYKIYRGPLYAYILLTTVSSLLVLIGIVLMHRFNEMIICDSNSVGEIPSMMIVTAIFSGLVVVGYLIHVLIHLIDTRGDIKRYWLEIVFFDKTYHRLCPCTNKRNVELPRVTVAVNEKDPTRNSSQYSEFDLVDGNTRPGNNNDQWSSNLRIKATDKLGSNSSNPRNDFGNTPLARQNSEPNLTTLGGNAYPDQKEDRYYSLQRPSRKQYHPGIEPHSTTSTMTSNVGSPPANSSVSQLPVHKGERNFNAMPLKNNPEPPKPRDSTHFVPIDVNNIKPPGDFRPNVEPQMYPQGRVPETNEGNQPGDRLSSRGNLWLPGLDVLRSRNSQPLDSNNSDDVFM